MDAGAWVLGSVLSTSDGKVGVKVSQDKWDKAKRYVEETLEEVKKGEPLQMDALLWRRGFLQYVRRTYPIMVPYMRGLHNTIDSWRSNRDSKTGWYTSSRGSGKRHKGMRGHQEEFEDTEWNDFDETEAELPWTVERMRRHHRRSCLWRVCVRIWKLWGR